MTTKQPAAVASGLHTDYYHHEDKPMEQCVCVCVCGQLANRQCVFVCHLNICVDVRIYCVFAYFCTYMCVSNKC